jgi:hypothetical protein
VSFDTITICVASQGVFIIIIIIVVVVVVVVVVYFIVTRPEDFWIYPCNMCES